MKNENFKIQMIAIQVLYEKYGFCPAPQQVKLLESDGEGTYILFRVGEHEYRCDNGMILNIEDGKKSEKALDEYPHLWTGECHSDAHQTDRGHTHRSSGYDRTIINNSCHWWFPIEKQEGENEYFF